MRQEENKKYSPMILQYLEIKKDYPDTLVFYRLGDFYEMFFSDAVKVSKLLNLVLTGKDAGVSEKVPMCGVPYHSVSSYIEKLIELNYKIAIVEQVEDPKVVKGIVKREVVQVITPGALINFGLNDNDNNFILGIEDYKEELILSFLDLSTGEIILKIIPSSFENIMSEIISYNIKEVVINKSFSEKLLKEIQKNKSLTISYQNSFVREDEKFLKITNNLEDPRNITAIKRIYSYLLTTQKRSLDHLKEVKVFSLKNTLIMDYHAKNNLELIKTIREQERYGSLIWLLDSCKTALGSRLLKKWILSPLYDEKQINKRLDIVESFIDTYFIRIEVREYLNAIYDLERIIAKVNYGNVNPKDLVQLRKSLEVIPYIKSALQNSDNKILFELSTQIEKFDNLKKLLDESIEENPPLILKDGGIIKSGFNDELDELKDITTNAKKHIARIEQKERERSGIKALKIGYNRIFGYYIEITNSYLNQLNPDLGYERKQTLSNSERFVTSELKEIEKKILKAEERIIELELELFEFIKNEIKKETKKIQSLADSISYIDVLSNFAEVSLKNNYIKPTFNQENKYDVKSMRHPILEKLIGEENFVSNDFYLDSNNFFYLITGPNMGGKSTIMKQVALLTIMAQIGCYVACKQASLPLIDKIFTRIGSSDDLVSGQSTFMIEMSETKYTLNNATSNSLILFDEIGRGTSTYDGMALAQAIIEYICVNLKCKTLFSTHYHELTFLEEKIPGLLNKNVSIYEEKDNIIFLYKLVSGPANKSYGINVAKLAKLPSNLIKRSEVILKELESKQPISGIKKEIIIKEVEPSYVKELKALDPLKLSPLDALNYLYELKQKIIKEDENE